MRKWVHLMVLLSSYCLTHSLLISFQSVPIPYYKCQLGRVKFSLFFSGPCLKSYSDWVWLVRLDTALDVLNWKHSSILFSRITRERERERERGRERERLSIHKYLLTGCCNEFTACGPGKSWSPVGLWLVDEAWTSLRWQWVYNLPFFPAWFVNSRCHCGRWSSTVWPLLTRLGLHQLGSSTRCRDLWLSVKKSVTGISHFTIQGLRWTP